MEQTNITGKVKVAYEKNGGIMFEEQDGTWYNADKATKDKVVRDLVGKIVTLSLDDTGKKQFNALVVQAEQGTLNEPQQSVPTKTSTTNSTQDSIQRQCSLKAAIEIVKLAHEMKKSVEDVDALVKLAAERANDWIRGE